jgi:hypothetical protein
MAEDPNVAALRAAGHDAAADLLDRVAQDAAGKRGSVAPAAIRLLDADPAEAQRRREGAAVLDGIRAAGIGGGWVSADELIGGGR